MTDDSDGPWVLRDPWTATHPDHPEMDDVSATILDHAVVQPTLLRSPLMLGDALAELHAMVSLLAELHTSLPRTVAAPRDQDHVARHRQPTPDHAGIRPASSRRTRTSDTDDSDVMPTGHDDEAPTHR